jgi:hypothetical protein
MAFSKEKKIIEGVACRKRVCFFAPKRKALTCDKKSITQSVKDENEVILDRL